MKGQRLCWGSASGEGRLYPGNRGEILVLRHIGWIGENESAVLPTRARRREQKINDESIRGRNDTIGMVNQS